ncbi:MAG: putative repeat protein (TIGR03806 family) [Crocinitomix sp.]|jgi:uncharacterized repeat protein (TIGR03806 family)
MTKHTFGSLFILICIVLLLQACNKDNIEKYDSNEMALKLSDYNVYAGNPSDLIPEADYKLYELSSILFTDHAEKQRLVKIPVGTEIVTLGDGLMIFPEGTIIIKTFYFYNDKSAISKGKNIIETRLLIKSDNEWKVGTYKWNESQTDANLITSGFDQTVNWVDDNGLANVITYHIPSNTECIACHQSNDEIIPIGTKTRNLNFDITVDGVTQNQLSYLHEEGVLNAMEPSSFSALPDFTNADFSEEERARAYLEMNCAHCHTAGGLADYKTPRFSYETVLSDSKIPEYKLDIIDKMETGAMPKAGTTILDEQGIEILRAYLNKL